MKLNAKQNHYNICTLFRFNLCYVVNTFIASYPAMSRLLVNNGGILMTTCRTIRHKPWIPKFKLIRQMQPWVGPFDPDQVFMGGKTGSDRATTSEIREHLRRNGLMPPLIFQDRPINLTHSG